MNKPTPLYKTAPVLFLAMCLTILGAKLWLIDQFASSIPYWDQWDAEGELFSLYERGMANWKTFIWPHNEHRILFSRLLSFAELFANGQWDAFYQTVVNAVLHTGVALLMAVAFWRLAGKRYPVMIAWLLAVGFSLPYTWQNTLAGFQSQFYFSELFSFLVIICAGTQAPFSRFWWLGVLFVLCATFSMASGMLAPAAAAAAMAPRLVREREQWRRNLAGIGVYMGLFVAVYLAFSNHVPGHDEFKAQNFREFYEAIRCYLSWPSHNNRMFVLNWAPYGFLVVLALIPGRKVSKLHELLLGVGAWVLLCAAGGAYARGNVPGDIASRYMDFLNVGFVVNGVALCSLGIDFSETKRAWLWTRLIIVFALLWAGVSLYGQGTRAYYAYKHDAPRRGFHYEKQIESVQEFLATDDIEVLKSKPVLHSPYPDAEVLAKYLRDPHITAVLPVSVRRPVLVEPAESTTEFVKDIVPKGAPKLVGTPVWSSLGHKKGAEFVSEWMTSGTASYLRFYVLGVSDAAQELYVESKTGEKQAADLSDIQPGVWREVDIPVSSAAYRIVARDGSVGWFAFSAPREMGELSYWAEVIAGLGYAFMSMGFFGLVVTRPYLD